MEETITTLVVFGGIYFLIKVLTDFLLKRRLINAGHIDKAGILEVSRDKEVSTYPTLKWGLVTLFAGLGLLIISQLDKGTPINSYAESIHYYFSIGIELVAVSLGFLLYFIIMRLISKQ
jgi:hypothetical protein